MLTFTEKKQQLKSHYNCTRPRSGTSIPNLDVQHPTYVKISMGVYIKSKALN